MRAALSVPLLVGMLLVLPGCGNSVTPVAVPPDTSSWPRCDSPQYASWQRVPVGTVVRRQSVTSSETGTASTTSIETFTLKEVTEHEAVVERQNTTERSDGSYRVENPPQLLRYPRQFPLPPGMSPEDFSKPSPTAKKVGQETVTVQGKQYQTTVYAWSDATESGTMDIRVWLSEEMPGRIVKQVMSVPRLKNTTVDKVIDLSMP